VAHPHDDDVEMESEDRGRITVSIDQLFEEALKNPAFERQKYEA
jgi:hypothetical protein